MKICKVCNSTFKSNHSLSAHIKIHGYDKKSYYDEFLKSKDEGICYCGNETTFRGNSYLKFCSHICASNNTERRKKLSDNAKGKKQSKETIEKRIKNTDQKKKEETRYNTMIERYGKSYHVFDDQSRSHKISSALKGRKHTVNHHKNVIESKRKNNTLNHSQVTKDKIRKSVLKVYESEDCPVTISNGSPKWYKTGYYNNIFYRSSYELTFLEYCFNNGIAVGSAATKEFRIRYFDDESNKFKHYYPDFYLEKYDVIIEIKPIGRLHDQNISKIHAGMQKYRLHVVDEEVLENLQCFFEELENEYLFSV